MRRFRLLSAVLLGLLCITAGASATPPGKNGKLAFRRWFNPQHTWGAIFTANPDGSAVRQITHPRKFAADVEPDWSPNGTQIVFQRIDVNGCGGGCETDEIDVVWSDGSRLVRIGYDPSGKGCIKAGSRPAGGICRSVPVWSPDGKQIAYQCQVQPSPSDPGYTRICLMNPDGSNIRELEQDEASGLDDGLPAWSPDGKKIAFSRGVQDQRAVFVMDANGGNARQVTAWRLRGWQPDWSPDGKRLVFYSNGDGPQNVSANLYTLTPYGTGLKQLTHARGGKVQYLSASYSPDGKWIAAGRTPVVGTVGNADIFVMRPDRTGLRDVTRSTIWDSGVDWGPRSTS